MFASKNRNKKFRARKTSVEGDETIEGIENKRQNEDVHMKDVSTYEEPALVKPAADLHKKAPHKDTKKSLLTFGDEVSIFEGCLHYFWYTDIIRKFFTIY